MNGFWEEVGTVLDELLKSYKDQLVLRLQQGYEDSQYRFANNIEEADVIQLVETSSLELDIAEQFFEEIENLCDLYGIEFGHE